MAKAKKSAKSRAVTKKKPAVKKKSAVAKKAKPAKKAAPRKPIPFKPQRVEAAKQQPKKLTPKQFAERLKAEQKARAAGKGGAKPAKAGPVAPVTELKPKTRQRLTAKEKALVKEFERKELSPADAEARRNRLRNLVMLGKERSFLTYAEINDHLPDRSEEHTSEL